jgi:hypothetical protein
LHCNENPIDVFLEKELRGLSPNFHIHVSVIDLYIPRIGPNIFLQQNRLCWEYLFRIFGIVSLQCAPFDHWALIRCCIGCPLLPGCHPKALFSQALSSKSLSAKALFSKALSSKVFSTKELSSKALSSKALSSKALSSKALSS